MNRRTRSVSADTIDCVAVHPLKDAAAFAMIASIITEKTWRQRHDGKLQPARPQSVAPETAMPASRPFFNAGASLTPSPVMPTMLAVLLQHVDDI